MIVYRIGHTRYANDLTGEGARLNGGRWNHVMTPCLYTAESRALAVLEYTVNVSINNIPRALSLTTIEVPDSWMEICTEARLPGDWKSDPAPASARDFGTKWLKAAEKLLMKIPSTVIPEEWNCIINPLHPGSKYCKVIDVRDFVYDVRIKLK